jgi:hypothetical protein
MSDAGEAGFVLGDAPAPKQARIAGTEGAADRIQAM